MESSRADDAPFAALTPPDDAHGAPRRVGVEIEFGGLTEAEVAGIAADDLGGRSVDHGDYRHTVENSGLGRLEVVLDTAWRKAGDTALVERGLELGRAVVPVEIVTEPILPARLPRLDALLAVLRDRGATGSRDGLLLGFGVHLNVAVTDMTAPAILPTVRAFALLEDQLRAADPIDPSRRLLPFVDPYPRALVDALAAEEAGGWSLDRLAATYLELSPSRNRALDLLPILREHDAGPVETALGAAAEAVGARPAYHFRLPDSRLDEPGWSLALGWNQWCHVEAVASDAALLETLAAEWRAHRDSLTTIRPDWAARSGEILAEAGLAP
jgi:hypothetical protein